MTQKEHIEIIGKRWGDDGFLGKLRGGIFDKQSYNDLLNALSRIEINDDDLIERELVQVLWFIPIFMYRVKEYFPEVPPKDYDALRENLEQQLARIFQYP